MNSFSFKIALKVTTYVLCLSSVITLFSFIFVPQGAQAQSVQFSKPYVESTGNMFNQNSLTGKTDSERVIARGRRTPPKGYKDTPDNDFQYGDDPDHVVQRDNTTGTNLDNFGTAYQESNPMQTGELGDATGNGWTAPRGNGW